MDVALAIIGAVIVLVTVAFVVREQRWLHHVQAMADQCRREYEAKRESGQ